jgi:DNA-binding NarL/FixJ family response regulator
MRILLAYSDSDARRAIRTLVAPLMSEVLWGESTTLAQAAGLCRARWDVVIVDAKLGAGEGVPLDETIRRLEEIAPETPILVVTTRQTPSECAAATRAGAAAYVETRSGGRLIDLITEAATRGVIALGIQDSETPPMVVRRRTSGGPPPRRARSCATSSR